MRCCSVAAARQEPLDAGSDRIIQQRSSSLVRIGPCSIKNNIILVWYSLMVMEGSCDHEA
jgi:hypothetical protein